MPEPATAFDLPASIPAEDALILEHILTALQSLQGATVGYKVDVVKPKGYLLRATLPQKDPFELTLDDLLFLRSIHPARVERIALVRSVAGAPCELVLLVLDAQQPVMVTSSVVFFSATRKRKFQPLLLKEAGASDPA
jgi:hypothetical protein